MNLKKAVGWAIILVLSFLPAVAWRFLKPERAGLTPFAEATHSLGQLAALIGMTMFALTFVLSTRLKPIEDMFGGLDKVYLAHGVLGGTALILIIFHPVLLVLKYVPQSMDVAAIYLLPSGTFWSVNFGIIALLGLIGLVFITLFTKIRYNRWKMSHRFLGLVFIFAVLHIFMVRGEASRDIIFDGYYVYAAIVSAIGLLAFGYSLLANNTRLMRGAIYRIDSIDKKKKGFFGLTLSPLGKPLKYKSGQFVFLRFYNEELSKEAHPFSIASGSNNENIRVVIKSLGDFTNNLGKLSVGDKVAVEGPYGRFNKSESCSQVWVAGGIGITPFIGMAEDLKKISCRADLYYSVRSADEFVHLDYLKSIEKATNSRFRVIPWVSSESGHLTVDAIHKKSKPLYEKSFYLCGPKPLKDSLKKSLKRIGVPENKIYDEEFSLR